MSFHRIKDLFEELSALAPGARTERLLETDIGAETRAALRRLLDLDDAMAAHPEQVLPSRTDAVPEQIGPFTIDGLMAEGGMGRVYRAHRDVSGVRQMLAIKVVRRDRLDSATRARFQLERQVLAVLKHPHIAAMIDVGDTADGQPYLALEYIEGQHITTYAATKQLSLRARVQLFRDVASAVAYAHSNLIVHRDLKPSNVLVDANGTAKVIDFGIAKPLMSRFGESEVGETQTAQRFFSPHSAAPEQLQGGLVTPSCDVYGLGALLYELLCGKPIFDFTGMNGIGIEKAILNEEPRAPSARMGAEAASGYESDADLDAIALVCLRKRPEDRYSSVEKLIEDLDAWLAARPVLARRGGNWYRIQRFVARNRSVLAVAASVMVIVVLALGYSISERLHSLAQRARADQFSSVLINAIRAADPGRGNAKDMRVRDLFAVLAAQIHDDQNLAKGDRHDMLLRISEVFWRLGIADRAQAILDGLPVPDSRDASRYADHQFLRARVLQSQSKFTETAAVYDEIERVMGSRHVVDLKLGRARLAYADGKEQTIIPELQALAGLTLTRDQQNERQYTLGQSLQMLLRFDEAKVAYEAALADIEQNGDSPTIDALTLHKALLLLGTRMGDLALSEHHYQAIKTRNEKYFGEDSLAAASLLESRFLLEDMKGNNKEAAASQRKAVALYTRFLPADSPRLAMARFNLASAEYKTGDKAAGRQQYQEAVAIADAVWPDHDSNRFLFRIAYSAQLLSDGDLTAASDAVLPAIQNAAQHENLRQDEIYPLALAIRAGGEYARMRTPESKAAFERAFAVASEAAKWRETIEAITELRESLRRQGLVVPDLRPASS
ncbi:hypothetical protein C7S18_04335 [Ahniella affigens]|uniref:Protein kinase domain-containing protein n=1 Tax=Ahniella affigens TaxID=2021234 RepID=A0A2P1PNQ1_9GAMM|nr:serine/threonine-protein kinase [Ahniella affigens]AVP96469.1 hypothetical protein C7S18_04335 [Ahniella affigens]